MEGDFQLGSMFFLDVQPRAPRDGNTTIIQTNLHDGMACSVLTAGVMVQFANSIHFLSMLKGLSIINDEKQMPVLFREQTPQHIQSNLLHYNRIIPDAAPEKFTMIGPVSPPLVSPRESPEVLWPGGQ